jgi:hypothetical protein
VPTAGTIDMERFDEHYHYHFLAQIAHRIILSRVRRELFNSMPSVALAEELQHQLEQWRSSLPQPLLAGGTPRPSSGWVCPADQLATSLLETRYRVGRYHLGRPFCYKLIHSPEAVTSAELAMCKHALLYAMDWPLASGLSTSMSTFMPLRFFVAGHAFGQLLIFWALKHSSDPRAHEVLPENHEAWCRTMLNYISGLRECSPAVAKYWEMLIHLYDTTALNT